MTPLGERLGGQRLALGTASFGGRVAPRAAERALATAWDEGIRVFDTARSYGYGDAEGILGAFLRGRPDEAFVITKCGIRVARSSRARRLAKAVARRVFDLAPWLRKRLRGTLGAQHAGGRFAPEDILASVEDSRRALGRDVLDLLMLHDAPLEVALDAAVHETLDGLVARGVVRAWGISTAPEIAAAALDAGVRPVAAWQCSDSLWSPGQERLAAALARRGGPRPLVIANQPFGGGAPLDALALRASRAAVAVGARPTLQHVLARPWPGLLAELALGAVLHGPLAPLVVCAMHDPRHIRANVRVLERGVFAADELAALRAALVA